MMLNLGHRETLLITPDQGRGPKGHTVCPIKREGSESLSQAHRERRNHRGAICDNPPGNHREKRAVCT